MALVNNASGVYATLGYNFSDPNGAIQQFSANTQANLNQFPPVIESWQAQDIASNSVGGYFQNPVATYVNTIITVCGELFTTANGASNTSPVYSGMGNIANAALGLTNTAASFLVHTNKVSGVTSMTGQSDIQVNPYYQSAIHYGKMAIQLTNQTDGIVNNSPILGSMTSILIGPQISANANTLNADYLILSAGSRANTISNSQIVQIMSDINNVNVYLSTSHSNDVAFYQRVENMVTQYQTVNQFSNMGDTESYLCNNFVGSSKLISRINS
jgi:hypothetical protein